MLSDLNQDDPEVARYLIQKTLWWVGVTGLDGIRQDTLPYVPRAFWSEWRQAIHEEYPDVSVVGEMWDGEAGRQTEETLLLQKVVLPKRTTDIST